MNPRWHLLKAFLLGALKGVLLVALVLIVVRILTGG